MLASSSIDVKYENVILEKTPRCGRTKCRRRKNGSTNSMSESARRRRSEDAQSLPPPKKRQEPFRFGTSLQKVPCVYLADCGSVPTFVVEAAEVIRENVACEGLFRKAGDLRRQSTLRKQVERGEPLSGLDVHDVTSLMKTFFRLLPVPLVPRLFHDPLLQSLQLPEDKRVDAVQGLCFALPAPHLSCLRFLMHLLAYVADHSPDNRMNARNLSVVLTPSLIRLKTGSKLMNQEELRALPLQTALVEYLIEHAHLIGAMTLKMHEQSLRLAETTLLEEKAKRDRRGRSAKERVRVARAVLGLVADLHFRPNSCSSVSDRQLMSSSCTSLASLDQCPRKDCHCHIHRRNRLGDNKIWRMYLADTRSVYSLPWSVVSQYCSVKYHRGPHSALAPGSFTSATARKFPGCERIAHAALLESWSRAVPFIRLPRKYREKSAFSDDSIQSAASNPASERTTTHPSSQEAQAAAAAARYTRGDFAAAKGSQTPATPSDVCETEEMSQDSGEGGGFDESPRTGSLAGQMKKEWSSAHSLQQSSKGPKSSQRNSRTERHRNRTDSVGERHSNSQYSIPAFEKSGSVQCPDVTGNTEEKTDQTNDHKTSSTSTSPRQLQEHGDDVHQTPVMSEDIHDSPADCETDHECSPVVCEVGYVPDTSQTPNTERRTGTSTESKQKMLPATRSISLLERPTLLAKLDGSRHIHAFSDSVLAQEPHKATFSRSEHDKLPTEKEQTDDKYEAVVTSEISLSPDPGDPDKSGSQTCGYTADSEAAKKDSRLSPDSHPESDDSFTVVRTLYNRNPISLSVSSENPVKYSSHHVLQGPRTDSDSVSSDQSQHGDLHDMTPSNVLMPVHRDGICYILPPHMSRNDATLSSDDSAFASQSSPAGCVLSPRRFIKEQMKMRMRESKQSGRPPIHPGRVKRSLLQSTRRNTISGFNAVQLPTYPNNSECACPDCAFSASPTHYSDQETDGRMVNETQSHMVHSQQPVIHNGRMYGHPAPAPQQFQQHVFDSGYPDHHHRSNLVLNRRRRLTTDGWFPHISRERQQHPGGVLHVGYFSQGPYDSCESWPEQRTVNTGYPEDVVYQNFPYSFDGYPDEAQSTAMHNGYHDQEAPCLLPSRPESFYIPISQAKPQTDHHEIMTTQTVSYPRRQYPVDVQGHHTAWVPHQTSSQTFLADRRRSAYAHRVLSGNDNGMGRQAMSRHRRVMMPQYETVRDPTPDPRWNFAHHHQHEGGAVHEQLRFSHCVGDGFPTEDKSFEQTGDGQVMMSGQPEGHRDTKPRAVRSGASRSATSHVTQLGLDSDHMDPRWITMGVRHRHSDGRLQMSGHESDGIYEKSVTDLQQQLEMMHVGVSNSLPQVPVDSHGRHVHQTPQNAVSEASAKGKLVTFRNFPSDFFSISMPEQGLGNMQYVPAQTGSSNETMLSEAETRSASQSTQDTLPYRANDSLGSVSVCSERVVQQNYNPNRTASNESTPLYTRQGGQEDYACSKSSSSSSSWNSFASSDSVFSGYSAQCVAGYAADAKGSHSDQRQKVSTSNNALTAESGSDDEGFDYRGSSCSSTEAAGSKDINVLNTVDGNVRVCCGNDVAFTAEDHGEKRNCILKVSQQNVVQHEPINTIPRKAYFEPDGDITLK